MADFDEGIMIIGSASDLWFEAVTSTQKYLSPQNGARFVVWGSSAPGMYDCLNASLSTARIPISSAPVGTYVCYLTNQGRPGTFRVNGLSIKCWLHNLEHTLIVKSTNMGGLDATIGRFLTYTCTATQVVLLKKQDNNAVQVEVAEEQRESVSIGVDLWISTAKF